MSKFQEFLTTCAYGSHFSGSNLYYIFAYWVFFYALLSSVDFFSKSTFSKKFFLENHQRSNGLDPDKTQHVHGPDLDRNILQRLSADDTSRQRVKKILTLRLLGSSADNFCNQLGQTRTNI